MNSFKITKKKGAKGVIIWGATNDVNDRMKCAAVLDYLQRILGPTLQKFKKKLSLLDNSYFESHENDIELF